MKGKRKKIKTDKSKGLAQAVVKVSELNAFVARLS